MENLIREYGLWAVFFGVMIEGDLTLLLAGVLAHYGLFSFGEALLTGIAGGFISDSVSYLLGHTGKQWVRNSRLYQHAQPRLEQLCQRFGIYSIFIVKYIYGLRTASALFYGFAPMKYRRFAPLTLLSCGVWVLVLAGAGYFFSGAVERLIGEVRRVGIILLVALLIALAILAAIYLLERFVIGPRVPELEPQIFMHSFDESEREPADSKTNRSIRNADSKLAD